MSTEQIWQTKATSLDDTLALAGQIGARLSGGEVIELVSDLGGGKTAFVRGLAKGMGSDDLVHSPSFTLSNEYKYGELTLYHFDFYRLPEAGIMRNEVSELLGDDKAIVVVEWANLVDDVLPDNRLTIKLTTIDDNSRDIEINYPESLEYLIINT